MAATPTDLAALYADENFPLPVVLELRQIGQDVVTAHEAGQANRRIADPNVLAFGTAAGLAVLTINRQDFVRLHRQRPAHAGIVVCRADPDAAGQALRIAAAIDVPRGLAGRLVRVYRPS